MLDKMQPSFPLPFRLDQLLTAFRRGIQRKCLLLLACLLPLTPAHAQVQTLWQVGNFDDSPVEFAHRAESSVTFAVGRSDPHKDWPGRQQTGHTYQIVFPLDSATGPYVLKIATLIEQPRVPTLRINVNGHVGSFYLHPKLSYSRSDFSYAFDPHESHSTVEADIPASFLKKGENTISITCVGDPPTPNGEEEIGGISYDALSFRQDQSASRSRMSQVTADVEPTIFYRQAGPN